jgi:hypothetical protein
MTAEDGAREERGERKRKGNTRHGRTPRWVGAAPRREASARVFS